MEQILEIRDGCTTPEQLLKSQAFARYLKIYTKEFIRDLENRPERQQHEAVQKISYIQDISPRDFLCILEHEEFDSTDSRNKARTLVRFMDGGFHHFRSRAYSRLIRLQNDVVSTGLETAATVKNKVTAKASMLSDLILETRRELFDRVGFEQGVRRSKGMEATPNVTAGEISGHYFNMPSDYYNLSHVPLTIAADIQTGVDYQTPSNKRAYPFYELDYNPFNDKDFVADDWISVPLQIGAWLVVAYIYKSRGCIEMEPGILNLFPFAKITDIKENRKPDGVFIFGDPAAKEDDLGYYHDKKNEILLGMVPNFDKYKYFGYAKKPILTIHNVLAINAGDVPLHCGCTRYVLRFNEEGEPYISDMLIRADDMGRLSLTEDDSGKIRPIFYGTEIGAFACLDGFSDQAKLQMIGQEVGYNKEEGSNARQIVPVTDAAEIMHAGDLDILLYMNNYDLVEPGSRTIKIDMTVMEAIQHFRQGERVAAGSTKTHRGQKESSYWANPFPLLKEADDTILHPDLYKKFQQNEKKLIEVLENLVEAGEMKVGVAHSQLMAGVYADNNDEDIKRCGYSKRSNVEQEGPVRLAEDLIDCIKRTAVTKRERLGGVDEVSVTVALIGDSRTGKSETAEKMEGVLRLNLV